MKSKGTMLLVDGAFCLLFSRLGRSNVWHYTLRSELRTWLDRLLRHGL